MSATGNGPAALLDERTLVIRILVLNRMHLDEWPAEPVEAIPGRGRGALPRPFPSLNMQVDS
jgi:hypothetical protein